MNTIVLLAGGLTGAAVGWALGYRSGVLLERSLWVQNAHKLGVATEDLEPLIPRRSQI